jgi:hypothetical protein
MARLAAMAEVPAPDFDPKSTSTQPARESAGCRSVVTIPSER